MPSEVQILVAEEAAKYESTKMYISNSLEEAAEEIKNLRQIMKKIIMATTGPALLNRNDADEMSQFTNTLNVKGGICCLF